MAHIRIVSEVFKSEYNHDTRRVTMRTAIKDVQEVDPPEFPEFEGVPVDGQRWIRQLTESFVGEELETRSELVAPLLPGATELLVDRVDRFPNNGFVTVSRGASNEETLTYTNRDLTNNKLTGLESPTQTHNIGDFVYPIVEVQFLGAFEILLRNFPIRLNTTQVLLNGTTVLREGTDYNVVNEFSGNTATRGFLQFVSGGEPRRFENNDQLEVTYDYFVQEIEQIEINTSFGETELVDVYTNQRFEEIVDDLCPPTRQFEARGSIKLTPPFGTQSQAPAPVTVTINDVKAPQDRTTTEDISSASPPADLAVSDVTGFPAAGTFLNEFDDINNRFVIVDNTDIIGYSDIDTVNNKLIGIAGVFSQDHEAGVSVALVDEGRLLRDTVKDAINSGSASGQLEAIGEDLGGRFLRIKTKVAGTSFNLQPGTYQLFYVEFDDETQRGLTEDITTVTPFTGNTLTFRDFQIIVDGRTTANSLLGQTVTREVIAGQQANR